MEIFSVMKKRCLKVGVVCGVNSCENEMFLSALREVADSMKQAGDEFELEVLTERPELSELYKAFSTESGYDVATATIVERLCESILTLKRQGAQEVVVLYGAQLYFPNDYIAEQVGSVHFVLYGTVRQMVKGVVQRVSSVSYLEERSRIERAGMLGSIGVMGLFRPAENFSGSDYLEEHIEKVSYSLVVPNERVKVWKMLSDAFYDNSMDASMKDFCLEETVKMAEIYQKCFNKKGLQGLFVTDFWTERLLDVIYPPKGFVGQVTLPNGLVLPTVNLEKVEAWTVIDGLLA